MRVYVTGGYGFLGSRVVEGLKTRGHEVERDDSSVDLRSPEAGIVISGRIEAFVHCAGVVGGFQGQQDLSLADNIVMGFNVLRMGRERGVPVVMAGSSCMYPDPCYGPYRESVMWEGSPYRGNMGYGIAKRVVAEAGRDYATTCVLPNLYGPGADESKSGHLVAGIARKIREAKTSGAESVAMLGDGTALRELLFVQDAAYALIFALERKLEPGIMNFGAGREYTVREVAETLRILLGYEGRLEWGSARDNGQQRKIMNSDLSRQAGWFAETSLIEGLKRVVDGR